MKAGGVVRKMKWLSVLTLLLLLAAAAAGCGGKQAQEAKTANGLGVLDMEQVIKAHPKYKELQAVQQQAADMSGQLERQQALLRQHAQGAQQFSETADQELKEFDKTLTQELRSRAAAKEEELNRVLAAKAQELQRGAEQQFAAYAEEIDKTYQPQMMNVQLKLKAVPLKAEEQAALEAELAKLKEQYGQMLETKQQELSKQLDALMQPEKQKAEEQMGEYVKLVNEELSERAMAKQAELAKRHETINSTMSSGEQQFGDKQQQLVFKQQEAKAIQEAIIKSITEKTGKVAGDNGVHTVLANVVVNVNAVDLTAKVIAECNK